MDEDAFAYNIYNLPANVNDNFVSLNVSLNDLVAPAFAWYWTKTRDVTYQRRGDEVFLHAFDTSDWRFNWKEYNQVYRWSFDYVRWRTNPPMPSTVLKAANPCENPGQNPCNALWPDKAPAIVFALSSPSGIPTPTATITATDVQLTSAVIPWNTYKAADSQVEYGTTTKYGLSTPLTDTANNMTRSHKISLAGLKPATLYHFRVKSKDAAGNLAVSADMTFTTSAQPPQ